MYDLWYNQEKGDDCMKQELIKLHHARSAKDFPELRLEENEFVELAIKRSKLGLFFIWGAAIIGYIALLVAIVFLEFSNKSLFSSNMNHFAKSYLYLIVLILFGIITISAFVGTKVYRANRLYVTNKRLIYHQMLTLFSKSVNVIELLSIEDVSFTQNNIGDHLFKLGTIRMSTVGDETTYVFKFVNTPDDELDLITHLVHVEKEKTKRRHQPLDQSQAQPQTLPQTLPQTMPQTMPQNQPQLQPQVGSLATTSTQP